MLALHQFLAGDLLAGEQQGLSGLRAGAERVLKRPADFQRYLNSPVLMKLYKPVDGRKEFPGTLTAYNEADGSLTVDLNGTAYTFGKKDVALCRLRVEF